MGPEEIQRQYVLYIGAGAVATGGIISLLQALPLIVGSIRSGFRDLGALGQGGRARAGPSATCRSGSSASARSGWWPRSPRPT